MVTERFPRMDSRITPEIIRVFFSPLALIPCEERENGESLIIVIEKL